MKNISQIPKEELAEFEERGIQTSDLNDEISEIVKDSNNIKYIQAGLAFSGSIAGLVYAINKKKSFWGKVGFWILGGLIIGVPTGVVANVMISNKNEEIKKINKKISNL